MDYTNGYNTGTGLYENEVSEYTDLQADNLSVINTFYYAGIYQDPNLKNLVLQNQTDISNIKLNNTDLSGVVWDLSYNAFRKTGGTLTGNINLTGYDINKVRRIYLDNATDYLYSSSNNLIFGTLNITSQINTNTANIATNTSNIATNTSNIATNTSDIASIQTNYLNKTTTTTQETNNEIICKKLRIKGSSTGTITDANSGYFYYDGVYSYFGTNGGTGFSMSSNAFNITPTAGCYLTGYALVFSGSNVQTIIRGADYGTATGKKSLILQAGDDLLNQEHYIVFNVRDTLRDLYTIMRMDGRNERIECNRNLYINGAYGINFSSATTPATTTKRLYSNGTNLYWDGNQVLTGTLNYLPLTGGTLTGDLLFNGAIGIDLTSATLPATTTNKLYRNGSNLYFNGNQLLTGTLNYLPLTGGTLTGNLTMGTGANIISSDDISCDGLTATETNATASIATTFTLKNTSNYCNLLLNTTSRAGEQAYTIQQVANTDKLFSLCVQPQTSGNSYKGCIGINQEFQTDQTLSILKQSYTSYILGLVNNINTAKKALFDVDSNGTLYIRQSGGFYLKYDTTGYNTVYSYNPSGTATNFTITTPDSATNGSNYASFDIDGTNKAKLNLIYGGKTSFIQNDGTNVNVSLSTSGMSYYLKRNSGATIQTRYLLNGDHTFNDDTGTQLFKIESSTYKCIVGGASTNLKIWNDGTNGYLGTTTDTLYFQASNTNKVSITNSSHLMSCPRVAIYSDNRDALYIQGFG